MSPSGPRLQRYGIISTDSRYKSSILAVPKAQTWFSWFIFSLGFSFHSQHFLLLLDQLDQLSLFFTLLELAPSFILALSILNTALHGMVGSLVHILPSCLPEVFASPLGK